MSGATEPVLPARGRLGLWSSLLAIGTMPLVTVVTQTVMAVTKTEFDAEQTAKPVMFAILVVVAAVPISHLVGLGLGISALLRANEPRWLAVAGTTLNGLVVVGLIVFIWGYLGAHR